MVDEGERLGAYEILSRLGRGGMASLYLARRSGPADFSRHVAIKVVHEEHAGDPKLIAMLLDEARLSAHVQHPNVVHVEELGEADGRPYLVMEHVDGVTLASVCAGLARRKTHVSIELAVHIATQVAAGLHAAHDATDEHGRALGMVHRDVSPQNVMLSAHGHVKVIDFGVAKAKGRLTSTAHGALKGKLAYMAPEQARGDAVDRRTDVFALGVVLWELLTLRRLFYSKDPVESLVRIRTGRVTAPSAHRAEVGEALERVILKALAVDPADRFPTVRELRRALLEAGTPAVVEPMTVAALVRETALHEVEAARPTIGPELLDRTVVADFARPLPLSAELVLGRIRAALDAEDVAEAEASTDDLLLVFREAERLEGLVAARAGLAADQVRARLAAFRGDLSLELAVRRRIWETLEERGGEETARVRALVELARVLEALGASEQAEPLLRRAVDRELAKGTRELAAAQLALGRALGARDRFDSAEALTTAAAKTALACEDAALAIDAALEQAEVAFRSGRRCRARAEAERARRLARAAHSPAQHLRALAKISRAALSTRDTADAIAAAREAAALAARDPEGAATPELALTLAVGAELEGRREEAAAIRRAARELLETRAGAISDPAWRVRFLTRVPAHAELLLEEP